MNSVIIVTTKAFGPYHKEIAESLKKLGLQVFVSDWELKHINRIIRDNNLNPDTTIIHARTAGKRVSRILSRFEKRGYRVINRTSTLRLTSNKYLATEHAKENGFSVPKTEKFLKSDLSAIKGFIRKHNHCVLKPILTPGKARGIVFFDQVNSALPKLLGSISGDEVVLQEYIGYEKLIRVIVIGGKALVHQVTFKTGDLADLNLPVDEREVFWYENAPRKVLDLAEKIALSFASDICYIDFFQTKGQYIFNEINSASGFSKHDRVVPSPVHKEIAYYLSGCFK